MPTECSAQSFDFGTVKVAMWKRHSSARKLLHLFLRLVAGLRRALSGSSVLEQIGVGRFAVMANRFRHGFGKTGSRASTPRPGRPCCPSRFLGRSRSGRG
jgi:hypothetical protein